VKFLFVETGVTYVIDIKLSAFKSELTLIHLNVFTFMLLRRAKIDLPYRG